MTAADRASRRSSGGDPGPGSAPLLAAIRAHLASGTAATPAELAVRHDVRDLALGAGTDGPAGDRPADATAMVSALLERHPPGIGWILDGRYFLVDPVTTGIVATLRVTDQLLATGDVFDGPDLAPLALTGRTSFPLAGGGEAHRTVPAWKDMTGPEAFRFELPTAAIPHDVTVGDLLALRWDGAELSVTATTPTVDAGTDEAPAAIWASFESLHLGTSLQPGAPVEAQDLAAVARIDHGLFDEPLLPLSELAEAAGLSVHGDHVAAGGHDWAAWSERQQQQDAVDRLAAEHQLDRSRAETLQLALHEIGHPHGHTGMDATPPMDERELPPLLGALGDHDVVRALAAAGAYEQPELARNLADLAERLVRVGRGRDLATGHYLAAVAAEVRRDPEEAERRIGQAVEADPQHLPAARHAARLASLRGDATRALAVMEAAGTADQEPLADVLRRQRDRTPDGDPGQLPVADRIGWLLAKLRMYVTGPARVADVVEVAEILAGRLVGPVAEAAVQQLAGAAFTHGLLLWEGGALEDFLEVYGSLLPADEGDLARTWARSRLELWEVAAATPGEGLALRGLSTEASVEVRDARAGHAVTAGTVLLARVLDAVDRQVLPAMQVVTPARRDYLLSTVLPDRPNPLGWAAALAPWHGDR